MISDAQQTTGQHRKLRVYRVRRRLKTKCFFMNQAIDADPAIKFYYENIKGRRKNRGHLSEETIKGTHKSVRGFLNYLSVPITDHAISDLLDEKRKNPTCFIDDKLLTFSNLNPLISHRGQATFIKGIFGRNGVKLAPKIDCHFSKRTPKISDGILKEIFEAQDFEKQTMMELQAYSGERIQCLARQISVSQIKMYNEAYATITIEHWQTKARIPHICVIPRRVAQAVVDIAERTGRESTFPNYGSLWREITIYALNRHGVRLTSHYLRKRFHTIAQKTAMPVNHWDYLMGDSMKEGHEAATYTLDDDTEIVREYDRYLSPRLSLTNPQDDYLTTLNPTNEIGKLTETVETLSKQIARLLDENVELRQMLSKTPSARPTLIDSCPPSQHPNSFHTPPSTYDKDEHQSQET